MEKWVNNLNTWYCSYCDSFRDLTADQKRNFDIKKGHSMRVGELSVELANKLNYTEREIELAYFIGLFHDIGRYKQLIEFNTFHDSKSVDHAEYGVKILKEEKVLEKFKIEDEDTIYEAILHHNKFDLPQDLSEEQLKFAQLIRDADKLDILKVLTDYYAMRNGSANHTLTWELPSGTEVSKAVVKEVLSGKLVSKKNVVSEMDVKIMQMSWVYDINYRPAFEYLLKNRFLESIYKTLPKNDTVISIHRKVKVYSENKLF